jgi:threonine/homoserine/homoserine lactone efflux protein
MTPLSSILAFALAAGVLTITPGLDTALVLRTATVEGPRRAWQAGLGIVLGCLVWGVVASVGIGALLAASRTAYDALRIVGAGYLLYLGVRLLARAGRHGTAPASPDTPRAPRGGRSWFARGLLTNLLNPKVGVFYATFLPQFVPHGVNVTGFSLLLAAVHGLEGTLWFALLIAATRPLTHWLARPAVQATFDRATGVVFVACGVRLALERERV